MGEAVDPHRAISTAHDFGLAGAVGDALERVGQGLAHEFLRVCEHVSDGGAGEILVVERQDHIREQYAVALMGDDALRRGLRDAARSRDVLGLPGDEGFTLPCRSPG